jgi:hypothetical protein
MALDYWPVAMSSSVACCTVHTQLEWLLTP